ncbi:MAG: recombinase A [Deltaproteobacteria bacterium]|nr:recombinase A [Deltaproteobacteria bacterium]
MASFPLSSVDPLEKLRISPHDVGLRAKPLPLGIQSLDAGLPDAGLPRGGVVEIGSPAGLGRATALALAACVSAQRGSAQRGSAQRASAQRASAQRASAQRASAQRASLPATSEEDCAWCAWIDSSHTLYAPGVIQAGVELERLLVVRPDPEDIARIAVRVTASGAFSVVVIDRSGVPGAGLGDSRARWHIVVRRLALAAEANHTTVLLLSSTSVARKEALPTAMRLELSRPNHERLSLRITKDRRGRLRGPISVDLLDLLGPRGAAAGACPDGACPDGASPVGASLGLHALP